MQVRAEPIPGAHWLALYTRGRHEKQVERLLAERGLETYVPRLSQRRRWSDRLQVVELPLFPSYVFARFPADELPAVLEIPGVVSVVRCDGRPARIRPQELDNVRRFVAALGGSERDLPLPVRLPAAGDRVEILTGPFAGVHGQVIEARAPRRVLVGLAALGQGFAINVEHASLRRVPDDLP